MKTRLQYGRAKAEERVQEDEEYAEWLKDFFPEMYYSFESTPDPPE